MTAPWKRFESEPAPESVVVPTWTLTTLVGLLALLVFVYAIRWVLLPFVIAGVIAYVCMPLIDLLGRRMPRALASVTIFCFLVAAIAGVGWLGLPPLIEEAKAVVSDFGGTIERLARAIIGSGTVQLFGESTSAAGIAQAAVVGARNWIGNAGTLLDIVAVSFAAFFGSFLTLVLLFYFLISGRSLGRGLLWLVPPRHRKFAEHIWRRIDPVLRRYFIGVILVVTYAAIVAYIGLGVILGIHHAVFLALMTGILEMIPVIGPAAAIAMAGLVAVQQATSAAAIFGYAIYAAALRLSIDQLLGPIVLGRAARVHPTLVIFCFMTGAVLFGIAGVILAVPIALAIRVVLMVLYESAPAK